jgi:ABC-type antimicrobial peptide transport system permease subunit
MMIWFMKTAARLFAVFGGLALFLAVVGVYGVKSYIVSRRTREIGIRMALGADAAKVRWMVLRESINLTALGLASGLGLSVLVGLALRGMVYGVKAIDPAILSTAAVVLAAAALIACYLPARRATQVQPISALRHE